MKNKNYLLLLTGVLALNLFASPARAATAEQRKRATTLIGQIALVESLGLNVPADGKTYPPTEDADAKLLIEILKRGGCVSLKHPEPLANWNYEVTGPDCPLRVTGKTKTVREPNASVIKSEDTNYSFFSVGSQFEKMSQILSSKFDYHFEQGSDPTQTNVIKYVDERVRVINTTQDGEVTYRQSVYEWSKPEGLFKNSHKEKKISLEFFDFVITGAITEETNGIGPAKISYLLDGRASGESEFTEAFLSTQF